jgi:hypothetical protein
MSLSLDIHYLQDVSNGNYTVGSESTDTLTLDRFNNLVNSFEPKLTSDGLAQAGVFVNNGEWGAAYLIADLCLHNALISGNSEVKKESWGNDYSYELRDKTVSEDYYKLKYEELVESLNQDEYGITEEVTEGVTREDAEIWFAAMDGNPLPKTDGSDGELIIRRWL